MSDRVRRHVAAFNTAVESGDWSDFATRFTEGARMTFVGVPAGPFAGRDAIARAYEQQPPTDTMSVVEVRADGDREVVAFRWSAGGTGTMRLTWADDLVADLEVSFDD